MLRWREARAAVKRHVKRQLGQPVSGRYLDGHGQAAAHVAERKVLLRVIPGALRCHVAVGFVRDQCVGIDRFPKLQNRGIGQNLTVFVPHLKLVRVLQDELDALPLAGLDVQGIGRLIRAVFHRDGDVGVPVDRHGCAALFVERVICSVGGDGYAEHEGTDKQAAAQRAQPWKFGKESVHAYRPPQGGDCPSCDVDLGRHFSIQ